jgi:gamma-glutamyltranspeptidase/glutathione hydrolase
VERKPLHVRWEGYDVYTMPPPSAGGMMLVQTLKLYGKKELERLGLESGAYQHLVAEALRAAVADRMRYLGDPAHLKVDMDELLSDRRMVARRRMIALDRTHGIPRFGLEEHGTHHLVAADAHGNVVSLTTTVNRLFGAKVVAEKSGIVLNDELDDFTANADVAPFNMTESPNRARSGARPVSSMTPTIVVKDNQVVLALGGSGGTTIATNVTQMVLSNLVFGNTPAQALAKRRFYIPTERAFILLEEGSPESLFDDLRARGEIVDLMPFKSSAVQMIAVQNGRKLAAADPRKHGVALAQ